jgi:hypothetical protein
MQHKHPVKAHTREEKRKSSKSMRSKEYGLPRAARRRIKKSNKRSKRDVENYGSLSII